MVDIEQLEQWYQNVGINIEVDPNFQIIYDLYKCNRLNIPNNSTNISSNIYNGIALYFKYREKYPEAKKYYLLAIELENIYAIGNYAIFLDMCEKDYISAKKYYKLAILKKNSVALDNYEDFLKRTQKNPFKIVKLLKKNLFKNKDQEIFKYLTNYYIFNKKYSDLLEFLVDYDQSEINNYFKYLNYGDIQIDDKFMEILKSKKIDINKIEIPLFKLLLNSLYEKIDLLDLHFKYSINNIGFEQARNDFICRISKT